MTQTIGVLLQNIAVSFKISLQTMLGAHTLVSASGQDACFGAGILNSWELLNPTGSIGAQDWTLYFSDKENRLVAVPPTRIG